MPHPKIIECHLLLQNLKYFLRIKALAPKPKKNEALKQLPDDCVTLRELYNFVRHFYPHLPIQIEKGVLRAKFPIVKQGLIPTSYGNKQRGRPLVHLMDLIVSSLRERKSRK